MGYCQEYLYTDVLTFQRKIEIKMHKYKSDILGGASISTIIEIDVNK